MSLAYYNQVINPDGVSVLGINNSVEKPSPLQETETQNQTEIEIENRQVIIIEIRSVYKLLSTLMFSLTFSYFLLFPFGYINTIDMVMSIISHYYVFKNDVKFLSIHTVYLILRFFIAIYFKFIEYLGYYFVYSFINTCTIITLVADHNNIITSRIQRRLDNVV
tara:strand:- start:601 stop:1092 length:492 start_codon:yes stop_codon:yes gene_type:complete